MNATTKVKLKDITPNLTCPLCKGYFVDATTIIECLHSFCKSCIVTHLEGSEYCPVCDVQLHSSKPLSSIRSDQMLQEVVYKLVPGLFQNEMERRRKFYKEHPNSIPTTQLDSGQMFNESYITSDDIIYLSLECQTTDTVVMESTKRYIKCPAGVSVGILKSLLQNKYDLSREATIDMMYGDRILPDDFLMMDIAYKYSWTPNGKHLPITFRVRGKTSLFKPIVPPSKEDPGGENQPVGEKRKSIVNRRNKSLANAKQPSEIPLTPKPLTNGKLNGKPNGVTPNTQIPIRGRRKKKSLDTEKELNRLRQAVSITESREKEVQLRISENGVMSARNVASGEEKIIASKSNAKGLPPESPNGAKSSLLIPQIVPASAKTPKSLIPTLAHSPKVKPSTPAVSSPTALPAIKSTNMVPNKTPKVPRKVTKPKPALEKPRAQTKYNKINKNMNLKAITLKIQEELEATINYFAAEITPINSAPAPKNPQPKEGQKYPAATLQPTDLQLASKHAKPPALNKRLHQTTIINGDVKFTKNVPPSPVKTVPKGRDSPAQPSLIASPTGSPQKTPKFFKSRHVEALGPQTPEPLPKLNNTVTSTSNVTTTVTSCNTSTATGNGSANSIYSNGILSHDTFQKGGLNKIADTDNPAKKVKLDQTSGPTLSLVTGTVTVPSLGGSAVSTGQQPSSFRYPVGFANGIPMSLVPFITNSCYSSPFLNNPNLKNMPVFTHPYLGFTAPSHVQSFPSNMTTNSFTHAQGFNSIVVPGPSNNTPIKSDVPKQTTLKLEQPPNKSPEVSKVLAKPYPESDKSLTEAKISDKSGFDESLNKAQTLLAKIHNLGMAVNNNGSGKNPRKSMSPAKISRIVVSSSSNLINSNISNSRNNNNSDGSNINNNNKINSSNISNTPVSNSESIPDKNSEPVITTTSPDSSSCSNGEATNCLDTSKTEIPPDQHRSNGSPSKTIQDVKADSNVNNNNQDTNQNLVAKNKDPSVVEEVANGPTTTSIVVPENATNSA